MHTRNHEQFTNILDAWLPQKIAYEYMPSLSIAVSLNKKVLYHKSFGFADAETHLAASIKTRYHAASISKLCTAIAIMQLVERGALALRNPAMRYLLPTSHTIDNRITIEHLLSHTSGMWRDGLSTHWSDGNFPTDLTSILTNKTLAFDPGTQFKYSNVGYAVLGKIIETVTGFTYNDYMKKHIFDPLLMHNTVSDYISPQKNIAVGYGRMLPHNNRAIFPHYATHVFAPATGLISCTKDLVCLADALTSPDSTILTAKSFAKMSRIIKKTDVNEGYGLGTEIISENKTKLVTHAGGFIGHASFLLIDHQRKISISVLTNTHHAPMEQISRSIHALVSNIEHEHVTQSVQAALHAYEGAYNNIMTDIIIKRYGNALISFPPDTDNPLGSASFLKNRRNNKFDVLSPRVYGTRGEHATFTFGEKEKADTFQQGSLLFTRVSEEKS